MLEERPGRTEIERVLSYKLGLLVTKDAERILIGTENAIKSRLEGQDEANIVYDETRPFGTFLLSLDEDTDGDWGTAVFRLVEAQELMHAPKVKRAFSRASAPELEAIAHDILQEKYDSGDPICQFVSMRIWYGYWLFREESSPRNCSLYLNAMQNLIRPFSYPCSYVDERIRVVSSNAIFRHAQELRPIDRENVIYCVRNRAGAECIMVDKSLLPLEKYYSTKFEKWKKYVVRCKICNRPFLADTLRYELCSDECRKQARSNNLAVRKQKKDVSQVDTICKSAAAYWYNRLTKLEESVEFTEDDVNEYRKAKDRFLKAKSRKRKEHRDGIITYTEFRDWLLHQEVEAQNVLESIWLHKGDTNGKRE